MGNDLQIVIKALLDEATSTKSINDQIQKIASKIDALKINFTVDDKVAGYLKNISDNIKNIVALSEKQNEIFQSNVQITKELDGTTTKFERQLLRNGSHIERTTTYINKQKQAIEDEAKEAGKLVSEYENLGEVVKRVSKENANGKLIAATDVFKNGNDTTSVASNQDGKVISVTRTQNIEKERKQTEALTQEKEKLRLKLLELAQLDVSRSRLGEVARVMNTSTNTDDLNKAKSMYDQLLKDTKELTNVERARIQVANQEIEATKKLADEKEKLRKKLLELAQLDTNRSRLGEVARSMNTATSLSDLEKANALYKQLLNDEQELLKVEKARYDAAKNADAKDNKEQLRVKNLGTNKADLSGIDIGNNSTIQEQIRALYGEKAVISELGQKWLDNERYVQQYSVSVQTGKDQVSRYKLTLDSATEALYQNSRVFESNANRNLSLMEQMRVAMSRIPIWATGMTAFYGGLHFIQDGIQFVNNLNKSLTEISIVQGYNQQQVAQLGKQYQQTAFDMSQLTANFTAGAVEFYRQGLGDQQVMERLRSSTQYAAISNLQFKDSAEILTAATNTMNITAQKASDVYSALGDSAATGADELGRAGQKFLGTAASIGVGFEKSMSWATVISSKTRESAETIGSSIKSILARIQSLKEKGFDSEDGTSINQVAKALSSVGIALTDQQGQFRNFGNVMDELGSKWSTLDSRHRAYLATTVAGKQGAPYHGNMIMKILSNWLRSPNRMIRGKLFSSLND